METDPFLGSLYPIAGCLSGCCELILLLVVVVVLVMLVFVAEDVPN